MIEILPLGAGFFFDHIQKGDEQPLK